MSQSWENKPTISSPAPEMLLGTTEEVLSGKAEGSIICQDCLNFLSKAPSNSIDLIFTDPPYGQGMANKKSVGAGIMAASTSYQPKDWDDKIPTEDYFLEMLRVSKNQIIFGGQFFTRFLPPSRCWLVWDKREGSASDNFADCEMAWTSFDAPNRLFRYLQRGMIRRHKEPRLHPTQKPEALAKWILHQFSLPGEIICDPFMGSGTFVVVAARLGRRYIGIDTESDYVEIAQSRLQKSQLQLC